MARADERGSDGGVSAAGTGQFTAPGWVRDENGALRRETIHRMGRRLPDFDYSSRRIYEITVVLEERRAVLGRLVKLSAGLSDLGPDGRGCELGQGWAVEPSEWGEVVLNCWREIEARWPQVSLIEAQLMPDHFHGVLFVKEALPKGKSLGSIIGGFKAGCTKGWREIGRQVFAAGGRVITLQNKGFSPLYKPGGKLFETCANGNLLMLAPAAWPYQVNEKPMTRFDATAMNRLAQWIAGEGAAEIDYKGMRPDNIDELARAAAKVKTTIHV